MSSPAFRRLFSQTARVGGRRSATTSSRGVGARRGIASDAHGAKAPSDTPWMIGSGVVTAIGAAYILTPRSKKHAHAAAKVATAPLEAALPPFKKSENAEVPIKDGEGTEASGAEVAETIGKSIEADSPVDAKAVEEKASSAEPEASTHFDDGVPGQPSEVNDEEKPEVQEKPRSSRSGTLQAEGESGPTDLGAARQSAVK